MECSSIDRLICIEGATFRVFERGAAEFSCDTDFSCLLARLGAEERSHHDTLCSVREFLEKHPTELSYLEVDDQAIPELEERLRWCEQLLDSGSISRNEMLSLAVDVEFSDLYNLFISIVNTLKGRCRSLGCARYDIYGHRLAIKRYILSRPDTYGLLERIDLVHRMTADNILIVDDNEMAQEFLTGLLSDRGSIDCAFNGKEALDMIRDKYYGVVVADLVLPVMSGVELFEMAVRFFPCIKDRFVFYSTLDADAADVFICESGVRHLTKPSPSIEIVEAVDELLCHGRLLAFDAMDALPGTSMTPQE